MINKLNEVLKTLKLIFKNSVKNILKGELFVTSDGYLTNKKVAIKKEFVKGLDSSVDAGFTVNNLTRGTYEKGMKLIDLEAKKETSKLVFELTTEYDGKKSVHIINKYVCTEYLFMILVNKLNIKTYGSFILGVNDNDDIIMIIPGANSERFENEFENDVMLDVVINEITEAKKQKEIELQKQNELVEKLVYENFKYHIKNSDNYLSILENKVIGNELKIVSPVKNFTSSYNVAMYDNGSWKTIFSTIKLSSYSKIITKKVCNKSIEILQDKNLFSELKETILNEIKEKNNMNNELKKDVRELIFNNIDIVKGFYNEFKKYKCTVDTLRVTKNSNSLLNRFVCIELDEQLKGYDDLQLSYEDDVLKNAILEEIKLAFTDFNKYTENEVKVYNSVKREILEKMNYTGEIIDATEYESFMDKYIKLSVDNFDIKNSYTKIVADDINTFCNNEDLKIALLNNRSMFKGINMVELISSCEYENEDFYDLELEFEYNGKVILNYDLELEFENDFYVDNNQISFELNIAEYETEKQLEDRLNREFEEYLDACILTEIEYVNENNVIVDSELSLSIYLDYINSNEAVEEYYPVEVIASEYDTIIDYDIFSDYAICKVDVVGTEVVECIKNIFTVNDKTTNNNGIGYVPSKEGVKVINDKFYIPINNYELALEEYNSIVNKYHELLLKFKTQDIIIQNDEVLNPLDRYKDDRIIKEKTQPIIDYFKMQGYNLNNCIEYNPTYDRYILNIDELINQILNNYEIRYLNDMQILHSVLKDNVLMYNKSGFKEYIILSIQKMFKKYKLLNFNSKQFEISNTT